MTAAMDLTAYSKRRGDPDHVAYRMQRDANIVNDLGGRYDWGGILMVIISDKY